MTLYGLPTCTICKRALTDLEASGITPTFRDIRAEPLTEQEWAPFIAEFGDTLVDKKSQTYRNLNAWMRESEAEAQLLDQPALMVRPLISDGTRMTLGWDAQARAVWLG